MLRGNQTCNFMLFLLFKHLLRGSVNDFFTHSNGYPLGYPLGYPCIKMLVF